jgi:hypothetical protein
MTRKIWLLNFALLTLCGVLGWQLRLRLIAGHSQQRQFLSQPPRAGAVIPPAPLPPLAPASPADYVEVAQKMLFSKDRNPNVIVQPPPHPPPPPPMPALPVYYGQMALGQPVVLLAVTPTTEQKSYHAGEDVGKFKVVAWDSESITLNWGRQGCGSQAGGSCAQGERRASRTATRSKHLERGAGEQSARRER